MAKGYLNELETTGASSPVATNTGAAYVHGFPCWNTTSKDTAIPTPSGNTRIDRLVLRAGWSAQTIRITRIAGTEGSGTPPAIVQTDGTTWDIPLYRANITTGGVITLTDEREFLHPNIGINTDMLDDAAVTLAKMAANSVDDTKAGNRVPQFYRRQGGSATIWSTQGVTTYTPTAVRMQGGVLEFDFLSDSVLSQPITFPVAFSYAPLVLATVEVSSGYRVFLIVHSLTTTGCYFELYTDNGSDVTATFDVHWLAIGPE